MALRARLCNFRLRMALSFHPLSIGDVRAIAEGMAGVIRRQGGTIRLGETVDRIETGAGRAAGVTLQDGRRLPAAAVGTNADAGHTCSRLLPGRRRCWTGGKLSRTRWSMGLVVW